MRKYRVKSFSRPDVVHTVTQHDNGDWSCDCEYALYKNKTCDHVRRVRHQKMKSHGYAVQRSKKRTANIKRYNLLCKRYIIKKDKLIKLNVGRIAEITRLYKE